jgi:hypothetical protein
MIVTPSAKLVITTDGPATSKICALPALTMLKKNTISAESGTASRVL